MSNAIIAFGSNEGEREKHIERAIEYMKEIPMTRVVKVSNYKEYAAMEEAVGQNAFINGVLLVSTELTPIDFLHKLQVIERRLGRENKGEMKPRTIDLDIIAFDDLVIQGKSLIIPHPKMHERIFVLEPLSEIYNDWNHPKIKKNVHDMLGDLKATSSLNENHS